MPSRYLEPQSRVIGLKGRGMISPSAVSYFSIQLLANRDRDHSNGIILHSEISTITSAFYFIFFATKICPIVFCFFISYENSGAKEDNDDGNGWA